MTEPQFDSYLRTVLDEAGVLARDDDSATIEARHVLLAMAGQGGTEAKRVLESAGLGSEALKDGFQREYADSLGVAGVSLDAFDLPPATPDPSRRPQLGAWFKPAMERAAAAWGKGTPHSGHLLLGILGVEHGTVPRMLAAADLDRAALIERVRSEL